MNKFYMSNSYFFNLNFKWLLLAFFTWPLYSKAAPLISNVSAASGRSYVVAEMSIGASLYTDRSHQVTNFPVVFDKAAYIRTANDDKGNTSSSLLSFELNQNATLYVAYDPRATALPSWLNGWQKLQERISVNDPGTSYMSLYSKTFPAGSVNLGGNLASPATGSQMNYIILGTPNVTPLPLISNISSNSGRTYTLGEMAVNTAVYSDRAYQITGVPPALNQAAFIRTANDDKNNSSSSLLSFELSKNATLYVGYDPRAVALPSWLSSWQKETETISLNDPGTGYMALYSKTFSPGTVTLGGNLSSPATGAQMNYIVLGKPIVTPTACSPISTLPCEMIGTSLPVNLTFNEPTPNSILDSNGLGIGFTMVDTFSGIRLEADGISSNDSFPGYEPNKLLLKQGRLELTTNKGIASVSNNNQLNTLGVRIDSRSKLQAEVSLINPYYGSQSQQAGLWFGLNDKTFVKLVAMGNKIELRREVNNVSGTATTDVHNTSLIAGLDQQTVRLRLVVDPGTNTVEGFYSLDNGMNYTNVGDTYSVKTLSIEGMGLTSSTAYAGIFGTHRNGPNPVTYLFDSFYVKNLPIPIANNNRLFVENLDKFSSNDLMIFSKIQTPYRETTTDGTYTPYNQNHNKVKLRLHNKGIEALVITNITLSNTSAWKIQSFNNVSYDNTSFNNSTALPLTIASKAYVDLVVEFTTPNFATRVKAFNDTLYIASNDNQIPNKKVLLHGIYQNKGGGSNEPYAQELINLFGFKTRIGYVHTDGSIMGETLVPNSDEIMAPYLQRVDPSRPVYIIQMAAYHGCCGQAETIYWNNKNSTTYNPLFVQSSLDGQSVLPRKHLNSTTAQTTLAEANFNPTGAFGLKVANFYSDRNKNYQRKIAIRMWKAMDNNGNIIANSYIIGMDYIGNTSTNYDYNDNMYYISNVRPELGASFNPQLEAFPSALTFEPQLINTTQTLTVNLSNQGKTYSDGSSDPTVVIKQIEIVGAEPSQLSEFTVSTPAMTTLTPQSSTSLTVSFSPQQRGLKNVALLVHYSNSSLPLRIPLFGVANDANFEIGIVKRIKGASDVNMTIGGQTWESDINYRKGSIKLDKQTVAGLIANTELDLLYQTYLSAATDLAQTREEVPIANGNYLVRLHFVENVFTNPGARVVSINLENQLKIGNLDIFDEVGYRSALVKDVEVTVTDGVLNLVSNPTVNRLALAGMEIYQATSKAASKGARTATLGKELSTRRKLLVYPNPATDESQVWVEINGYAAQEPVQIELMDVAGRVIIRQPVIMDGHGKAKVMLRKTQGIKQGLYIVRTKGNSGKSQSKLLIE